MDKYLSRQVTRHTPLQGACQLVLFITIILLCTSCSRRYDELPAYWPLPFEDYENQSVGRFKSSYIADQLDEFYRGTDPGPIGVTTLVNVDDLYSSSTFGRMYAEQMMSELAMRGYKVIELRHSDALQFLGNSGEFGLSRDMTAVRRERELGAVLVGTYVVSPVRVYVNIRLLDPASSTVLSAGSVEMSKTKEIAKMLKQGGVVASLERIPVRHIGLATYPAPISQNWESRVYDLEEMAPPLNTGTEPQLPSIRKGPGPSTR